MIIPIYPKNNFNKDIVVYWENFLTEDDINKILSLPEWDNLNNGKIGNSITNQKINLNIRNTEVSFFSYTEETKDIWIKIKDTIEEVNRRFFHFDLTGCYEGAQLGLYDGNKKGHYNWHIDGTVYDLNVPRKLSMVLSLSEPSEFEGGLLQVKIDNDEPKTLELKKGRAWFFPSYVLHRVTPVTKGIRKSVVIWVGGPAFK